MSVLLLGISHKTAPVEVRERFAVSAGEIVDWVKDLVSRPGISEALVATAMGLFAAIPAVIAYNSYADKTVRLEIRYDGFTEEFSSILQRHARTQTRGAG